MNVKNITSYNQSSPAFGNLIIKNKKWFAERGMNIIKAVKENKELMQFANEPQNDVILGKGWDFYQDFSITIKEKGMKGIKWFSGNFTNECEKDIRNLNYKELSTCIQRVKDNRAQLKALKSAEEKPIKQAKSAEVTKNKRQEEPLKEIEELQS